MIENLNYKIGDLIFFKGGETPITNGIIESITIHKDSFVFSIRYFDGEYEIGKTTTKEVFKTFEEAISSFIADLKSDVFIIEEGLKEQIDNSDNTTDNDWCRLSRDLL